MAGVSFERVGKRYPGGAVAVHEVSLEIADGELMVLVGPSGCGKSTLLRMLAGLETITRGKIRIGSVVVNDRSPQARNIAMVFQDYALYPTMTVHDNLAFPLRMARVAKPELERRVARAAEMLELGPLLSRLPRQLSGGQRQRVAMGRALVREPAVFLLDEPLSNLDAKLRAQVRAEIAELQQRTGTTMLYVTHDQVEAMTLGHRVAVLDQGRLQQVAAPRELYRNPANLFVAAFIGSPPMNLVPARFSRIPQPAMLIGDQRLPLRALEAHVAERLHEGQNFTLGVRPEGLYVATVSTGLQGTVIHGEFLGHENLAHLRIAGVATTIVARLPGAQALATGETLALGMRTEDLRLFDEDGVACAMQVASTETLPPAP
ncbi:MAG: ABC transporter ATP-binding protein [Thiotrichales bacterium]